MDADTTQPAGRSGLGPRVDSIDLRGKKDDALMESREPSEHAGEQRSHLGLIGEAEVVSSGQLGNLRQALSDLALSEAGDSRWLTVALHSRGT